MKNKRIKKDWEYIKMINTKDKVIINKLNYYLMIFYIVAILLAFIWSLILIVKTNNKCIEKDILVKTLLEEQHSEKYFITLHNNIGKATLEKNTDSIFEYIDKVKPWFPDIIKAQVILESNNSTSVLAKTANNLFGMKKAFTRNTTQETLDYNGYGMYKNYQLCILDRILWDYHIFDNKPTREVYLNTLSNIYAEDKEYIKKLNKIIDNGQL